MALPNATANVSRINHDDDLRSAINDLETSAACPIVISFFSLSVIHLNPTSGVILQENYSIITIIKI
jgi:hypothetical protein